MSPDPPTRSRLNLTEWFWRWGERRAARLEVPHQVVPVDQITYPGELDQYAAWIQTADPQDRYGCCGLFAGQNEVLIDRVDFTATIHPGSTTGEVHLFNPPHDYDPFALYGTQTAPAMGPFAPLARIGTTQILSGCNVTYPRLTVYVGGVPQVIRMLGPRYWPARMSGTYFGGSMWVNGTRIGFERPIRLRSYDQFIVQGVAANTVVSCNFYWREIPAGGPPTRDGYEVQPL